jgi:hypothetical protein
MAKLWVSQSKGCWVDLFEEPHFAGRRLRLFGPADYVNLWVGPEEWGDEIRSMIAGPCAYVQCFEELNFKNSVAWVIPNQWVADVSALPTADELDSIRLFDRPPFASEPGFDAYAGFHGVPPEPP